MSLAECLGASEEYLAVVEKLKPLHDVWLNETLIRNPRLDSGEITITDFIASSLEKAYQENGGAKISTETLVFVARSIVILVLSLATEEPGAASEGERRLIDNARLAVEGVVPLNSEEREMQKFRVAALLVNAFNQGLFPKDNQVYNFARASHPTLGVFYTPEGNYDLALEGDAIIEQSIAMRHAIEETAKVLASRITRR